MRPFPVWRRNPPYAGPVVPPTLVFPTRFLEPRPWGPRACAILPWPGPGLTENPLDTSGSAGQCAPRVVSRMHVMPSAECFGHTAKRRTCAWAAIRVQLPRMDRGDPQWARHRDTLTSAGMITQLETQRCPHSQYRRSLRAGAQSLRGTCRVCRTPSLLSLDWGPSRASRHWGVCPQPPAPTRLGHI